MAVTFDASGVGQDGNLAAFSFNCTATAGSHVVLTFQHSTDKTLSNIQYGGQAMSLVGTVLDNNSAANGKLAVYELASAPGGTQAVTGSVSATCRFCVNSFAFNGVGGIEVAASGFGGGTSISTGEVTAAAGEMLLSAIGIGSGVPAALSDPTGGTNEYLVNQHNTGLAVSYASATTTFGATTTFNFYGYMVLRLSPPSGTTGTVTAAMQPVISAASGSADSPGALVAAMQPATASLAGGQAIPGAVVAALQAAVFSAGTPDSFAGVRAKLTGGQDAIMQFAGNSIPAGVGDGTFTGGYPTRVGKYLGERLDVNVRRQSYSTGGGGSWSSGTVVHTSTLGGGAPTLWIKNGGVGLSTLADQEGYLSNGFITDTPDWFCIDCCFNDISLPPGLTAQEFSDATVTYVGNVRAQIPDTPILVATQCVASNSNYDAALTQMSSDIVGQGIPLSPSLVASDSLSDVWVLDTRQAFDNVYQSELMTDGLHPNTAGYEVEAGWIVQQLAADLFPPVAGSITAALQAAAAVLSAEVAVSGGLAGVLRSATTALFGSIDGAATGALSAVLQPSVAALVGEHPMSGSVAATLAAVEFAATGTAPSGYYGAGYMTLTDAPTASMVLEDS